MNDQARWYGIGLAALPLGFVVLGLISFAIYFMKTDDDRADAAGNAENAGIFRKDIELADLRTYVEMLAVKIVELNVDKNTKLEP